MESKMRQFLDKNDFLNIPTPTLFKATPGVSILKNDFSNSNNKRLIFFLLNYSI